MSTTNDITINEIYSDNCHHDFYCHGWKLNNITPASRVDISINPAQNSVVRYFSPQNAAQPRAGIFNARAVIENSGWHYIKYGGGAVW